MRQAYYAKFLLHLPVLFAKTCLHSLLRSDLERFSRWFVLLHESLWSQRQYLIWHICALTYLLLDAQLSLQYAETLNNWRIFHSKWWFMCFPYIYLLYIVRDLVRFTGFKPWPCGTWNFFLLLVMTTTWGVRTRWTWRGAHTISDYEGEVACN